MKSQSRITIILLLLITALAVLSRPASAANEVTVLTDKQTYAVGDTVQITLVYNGPTVTLTFPTSCISTAIVQNATGAAVANLQQGCLQVITTVTLSPGITIGTFTWTAAPPPGTYTIVGTVIGTSFSGSKQITVGAPDFTISATSPAPLLVGPLATSTITVTAVNGFSGVVALSMSQLSAGLTCSAITPGTVTGSGTATVSCSSTTAGTFTILITGTSGSLVHTATATFNFVDFTIAASSPAQVNVGQSAVSTITVTALNGFTGVVSLTSAVPNGLTCGAIAPASITGSGNATLSCSSVTSNVYTVTISGTSGSLIHTTAAAFSIGVGPADFTISATSPAPVPPGVSVSSTITVAAVNGFTGIVTLTDVVPAGLTCGAITPSSVTGSGTATVSCSVSVASTFAVVITGTSGALSHSATFTFVFCDSCGGAISVTSPAPVPVGSSATSTITVTSINGFTGVVTLTDTIPAGLICGAITPSTITGSGTATVNCSSLTAGSYALTITAVSGSTVHSATATFTFTDFALSASPTSLVLGGCGGSSSTSTITISSVNGFSGVVSLSNTVSPVGLPVLLSPSSVVLSPGGSASATLTVTFPGVIGTFAVTVTGTSAPVSHSVVVNVVILGAGDYAVTVNPSSLSFLAGTSGTSTITVASVNGCSGTVALATSVSPAGLTCVITPASIVLGTAQTATLSCSSLVAGTYTVVVTATSGLLTHSASVTIAVTDFTLTANPASVTLLAGIPSSSIVTVTSVNGFSGDVNLAAVSSSTGLTATLNPTMVSVPSGGSSTSLLSITANATLAAGTFTVTVTGTSGTLTHSVTVNINDVANVAPVFTMAKLHWTHHLSLLKLVGVQTFTAIVDNPATNDWFVQVHITGSFDTGAPFTAQSAATLVAAGTTVNIVFTAPASNAVNFKVSFTASLMYGPTASSLPLLSPVTKSGSFAVVP